MIIQLYEGATFSTSHLCWALAFPEIVNQYPSILFIFKKHLILVRVMVNLDLISGQSGFNPENGGCKVAIHPGYDSNPSQFSITGPLTSMILGTLSQLTNLLISSPLSCNRYHPFSWHMVQSLYHTGAKHAWRRARNCLFCKTNK